MMGADGWGQAGETCSSLARLRMGKGGKAAYVAFQAGLQVLQPWRNSTNLANACTPPIPHAIV
jgi:hypothetical protein